MKLTNEQLDALRRAYRLAPRETQVLDLLVAGTSSNGEIARRLGTTEDAVKAAFRTLYLKMRVQGKTAVILLVAYRQWTAELSAARAMPTRECIEAAVKHMEERLLEEVARLRRQE